MSRPVIVPHEPHDEGEWTCRGTGSSKVSTMCLLDVLVDEDGAEQHVGQETPNLLLGLDLFGLFEHCS